MQVRKKILVIHDLNSFLSCVYNFRTGGKTVWFGGLWYTGRLSEKLAVRVDGEGDATFIVLHSVVHITSDRKKLCKK